MIEDDPRPRREMLLFIRELDAEAKVLEFNNSKDFEQKFILPLVKPKSEKKPNENALQGLKPEVIQYLNNARFNSEPPFPGDVLTLEVAKNDFTIQKSNLTSGKVFGDDLSTIFKDHPNIEKFITAEFKEVFLGFKKRVETEEEVTQVVAIEAPNREIWVIEIHAIKEKAHVLLNFRNRRSEVLKLLGKEEKVKTEEKAEVKCIDVVLFRSRCILEKDIPTWVTKISALSKKLNLWPENSRPKFVITRYEDDKQEKTELNHPFVDDMICMPFDRLVFLQKLEIVKNLPEKIDPSFLFVQESHDPIEIAKKLNIERMSDLGFAVSNPVALTPGTPGHFYFRFPGQKPLLDCYGRVTHSLPHPDRENEFLVFFSYFGLERNVLKEIRAYLSRDPGYKMILNTNPREFEFNPDNIFLQNHQKRNKAVVAIDADEKNLETLTGILKRDIGGLQVISDNSYYNIFRNYLSGTSANDKAPAAVKEDFYTDGVSLLVALENTDLQMPLSPATEENRLLGHDVLKMYSTPQGWLDLFKNSHARNLLTECLFIVQSVKRLTRNFELDAYDGSLKTVSVEIILEENQKMAKITLTPPEARNLPVRRVEPLEHLDALIIDLASVPGEVETFITGLKEAVSKSGVKTSENGPKIIFSGTEKQSKELGRLLKTDAIGFVIKPIEVKRLCYLLSTALDVPFTLYNFENIGWKVDNIAAKIGREAELIELAEFGATLKMNQKLKNGSMFYLFKSIFANAPDSNLCCRVYHAVEHDSEAGYFLNYVSYFGITDAFLKFTRSYIRETYAGKKAQESGGAEE